MTPEPHHIYLHSVSLDADKCKGCTSCMQRCPSEAIRIRDGHAIINSAVCIDCGACIRACKHQAKKAIFDRMEDIPDTYKLKIALPPPSLYGQFEGIDDVDVILQGLLNCGFDEVYEVSRAAELVTECTRRFLKKDDFPKPIISSACPAIVRIIRLRFPSLCEHLLPILPPIEVASRAARADALRRHPELKPEEICTIFISPCPAKTSYVKNGISRNNSDVDFSVSMSEIYKRLVKALKLPPREVISGTAGMIGISWGNTGGEASALMNDHYLAADGIDHAIAVLDKIETGDFPALDFVEINACPGGCVGGPATVENPFVARVRLQAIRRYRPVSMNRLPHDVSDVPSEYYLEKPITYAPAMRLDVNRGIAIQKMAEIETIYQMLPDIDCGFCGAPTCHAFAEDVVKGECTIDDCAALRRKRSEQASEGTK